MTSEKQAAMRRIRKCIALAQSSNPHEAAAAMRQAQALMTRHGIEGDIESAVYVERKFVDGKTRNDNSWDTNIAAAISKSMGLLMVVHGRESGERGKSRYAFIGPPERLALAEYAYQVLIKGAMKARSRFRRHPDYIYTIHRQKALRDFSVAYSLGLLHAIDSLHIPEDELAKMKEGMKGIYKDEGLTKVRPPPIARTRASMAGVVAAQEVRLDRPMGNGVGPLVRRIGEA